MSSSAEAARDDSAEDVAILDDLFDAACSAFAAGQPFDIEAAKVAHPHLTERIDELLMTAREIAVRGSGELPTIEGFQVLGELGRGAMGIVFLARELALGGRHVALKILPTGIGSESGRARFLVEARALARLRHPSIVAVHAVFDRPECTGFSMEWVEGRSLAAWIGMRATERETGVSRAPEGIAERSPQRWVPFVCRIGIDVGRALHEVHRAGLVHRDVKPSNILVRDSDHCGLLSDFGLVRDDEASLHTRTGAFVGTLAYAAPEQIAGRTVDARSDVYGLGATLYHALCGRRPHPEETAAATVRAIEDGQAASPRRVEPSIPRELSLVVEQAIDPDPERRYATAAELADDLQRVLDLRPIRARAPTVGYRIGRALRRNRGAALGVAVGACAVALLALVWGWVDSRRSEREREIETAVRQARLALFDAGLRRRLADAALGGELLFGDTLESGLERSRAGFERALALDPGRADLRRSVAVLAAARARMLGERAEISARLERELPVTVRALRDGVAAVAIAAVDTSGRDLRQFARVAYLSGDLEAAVAALMRCGSREPFDEVLLGEVHLALGQPALAYPRLLRAAEMYPNSGAMALDAADAASQCGDVAVAERLLEAARSAPRPAPPLEIRRVVADLAWRSGRVDEARAEYEGALSVHADGYLRSVQMNEARGDVAAAVRGWTNLIAIRPADPVARRGLLRTARRWWAGRSAAERRRLLVAGLEGEVAEVGSIFGLLHLVARSQRSSEHVPPAFGVGGGDVRVDRPTARTPFDTLARVLARLRPDLRRIAALPEAQRAAWVEAWLAGRDIGDELAEAGVRLSNGDSMFLRPTPGVASPWRLVRRVGTPALEAPGHWGAPLAALGDVDGDGVDEFALQARSETPHAGGVEVFSGMSGKRLLKLTGDAAFDRFGFSVARLDDVDRDGAADLVVGVPSGGARAAHVIGLSSRSGQVHCDVSAAAVATFGHRVVGWSAHDGLRFAVAAPGLGPDGTQRGRVIAFGVDSEPRWTARGEGERDSLGESLALLGDLDGDGVDDLIAGTEQRRGRDAVALILSGDDGRVLRRIPGPSSARVAGVGDQDGDGVPDFAIAWPPRPGRRAIGVCQVRSGASDDVLYEVRGARANDGFGEWIGAVGDLDGDGLAELAVTSMSELSITPPTIRVFAAGGRKLVDLPGWWRLVRLGGVEPARFAAVALGSWTRYSEVRLGGRASAAILEYAPSRGR